MKNETQRRKDAKANPQSPIPNPAQSADSPVPSPQSLAPVIMVLGTSSSAGKSLLVTALCRIYSRRGLRVAPFKAQNMSNNAGVCADGSEIGRAQITQAFAAGIAPTAAMNPILLKPESNMRSQVIVMGRAQETLPARSYFQRKQQFWSTVTDALDGLRKEYDLVIAEGAGSPVELNLKSNDIVNMAIAKYANAQVLLVGDIDRGGIFAQLLGSLWLLPPDEQDLIAGFVVNKFRGDPTLFEDGITILEEKGGKPVFGVLPWLKDLYLPEEDGVALDNLEPLKSNPNNVDIAVVKLPRISNFDDFDPLLRESGVTVRFVQNPADLGEPDAVILPGTKSTMADLMWLHETGFTEKIVALAEQGKHVVGVCGGYQMLGTAVFDPNHVESDQSAGKGVGLLPVETTFAGDKATHQMTGTISAKTGWLAALDGQPMTGYEIHMGRTTTESAWVEIGQRGKSAVSILDGAISANQKIWGCYVHGLFANENLRRAWLAQLGHIADSSASEADLIMTSIDRLADSVQANLQLDKYLQIT